MTEELLRAFNSVQKQMNALDSRIDNYFLEKHIKNASDISDSQDALCDLNTDIEARIEALEKKVAKLEGGKTNA